MSEVGFLQLVALPVGLGLLGFVEPCSLGSTLLFLKFVEGKPAAAKIVQTLLFAVTRAGFIGVLGAAAAIVGSAFVSYQTGAWVLLGIVYVLLGAALMAAYCQERGLPFVEFGKVVVPTSSAQTESLTALEARAKANGAAVELIDGARLLELEPQCAPASRALYSPRTASVDPQAVLARMVAELEARQVAVRWGVKVVGVDPTLRSLTLGSGERLTFSFMINAAGAHADEIAAAYGLGRRYAFAPFRGTYYELDPQADVELRGNIYPVPEPELPFLGVHFTKTVSGRVFVGPTALPALGREHYQGLQGVEWLQLPGLVGRQLRQFAGSGPVLRRHALAELGRLRQGALAREARLLVPRLRPEHLLPSAKVGIRSQLYDRETRELVADFVVEEAADSVHVLNVVSPGFTAALAMARVIADKVRP